MRYIMMVKATRKSEAGAMPTPEQIAVMGAYNAQLIEAGVLVDAAGLQATSKGFKICYSGGRQELVNGPFADTSNTVSGYWIIKVNSHEEALEWAKKAPNPAFGDDGEIEVRRFFEAEDFARA